MKVHFDDILIVPTPISSIDHRSDINPYDKFGMLPLVTAPMYDVVGPKSAYQYEKNKINPIIPRGVEVDGNYMQAYGLDEFVHKFINNTVECSKEKPALALIDVANGHMRKLMTVANSAKLKYGKSLVLMVGNVANPETYAMYAMIGVDYVRCGVGNGGSCLTTQQTGIGYPLASLIQECKRLKKLGTYRTKIVADGGIKDYAHAIKALALGADYVMMGGVFNKALESEADLLWQNNNYEYTKLNDDLVVKLKARPDIRSLIKDSRYYKQMRGMSTKSAQIEMGNDVIKTSEGTEKYQKVEYTLSQWVENFEHYLRTAMSYTDCKTLKEFNKIGSTNMIMISNKAYQGYNK